MANVAKIALQRLTLCSAAFAFAVSIAAAPVRAQDATTATPTQTQNQAPSGQNLSEFQPKSGQRRTNTDAGHRATLRLLHLTSRRLPATVFR